ncbi:hypothetical protein PCI56_12295 [Plesiomonas shigelloides subsp. oncorhynchi]|nr:hypothetical protein [Plesiomonas shigelloides]
MGFYEALDFTPSRLNRGETHALIRSYMAHHQGMGFLALSHALLGPCMPQRFSAEPLFKATQLLLQERMPKVISVYVQRQKFEPVWEERPALGMCVANLVLLIWHSRKSSCCLTPVIMCCLAKVAPATAVGISWR